MSREGWQVWDLVLRFSSQLRLAFSGQVIGFDLPALVRAGELLGYECGAVVEMMPAAEGGMLRGLRKLTAGGASGGEE